MNKKLLYKSLLAVAVSATLVSCDENAWNDDLDGFKAEEEAPIANKQTVEYTLTDADYSTIASNSTNKSLAEAAGAADALKAVGNAKSFSAQATAAEYVPAFLASTNFPYFTLTDGSAVKVTYRSSANLPAVLGEAAKAQLYTVSEEDYQNLWGSLDDYVEAFTPAHPAAKAIPGILNEMLDVNDGKYCVVSYNIATSEPNFGGSAAPAGPVEVLNQSFTESLGDFTIQDESLPEGLTYIWSWGGANYGAKASGYASGTNYDAASWLISPVIDLSKFKSAAMSFEQATNFFADVETMKAQAEVYGRVEGGQWTKLSIPTQPESMSWTFVATGDIDLSAFAGKKMQIGFKYTSTAAKAGTWEVKNLVVNASTEAAKAPLKASAYSVPSTVERTLYVNDGGEWAVAADFSVLTPADYTDMGQKYQNLTGAASYLPAYLKSNFPYAQSDDIENVMYLYYNSSSKETYYLCDQYQYNGSEWVLNDGTTTDQFVKSKGVWMYDPSVTIDLPVTKGDATSVLYYQACVDWVYNNICVPLGDTSIKSGKFYVTSYGNNEYYCGTSAYQCNIDLRPDKAREQYAAGYEGMTDDQIVATEKERFMNEVMPGALANLHADAKPVEGVDVIYTVNFGVYTGTTTMYTARFKVVGPGKFEPIDCTWDAAK